jgi:uncharacterized protein (TIRG00374 family)
MKNNYLRLFFSLLIVAITAWGIHKAFTSSVNIREVMAQLSTFSAVEITSIILLSTVMMVIRSFRFRMLLKNAGQDLSFWQGLKVYIIGQAFSPLPAGEGMRPVLLKKEAGIEPKASITPVIMLGVTEMIIAVLIALIGSIFLGILRLMAIIAFTGLLGLVWILINRKAVIALLKKLPDNPIIEKAGNSVLSTQKEMKSAMFKRRSWKPSRLFVTNETLAFLTSLCGAGILFLIARHFELSLSFLLSLYIYAAATVLGELVPFAPGGIGATEGGMTGILLISGIALPSALVVVLLYRAATLVYAVTLGLLFLTIFYSWDYLKKIRRLVPIS